jgi:1,4-dihydroxy-2-naphthoate octaprenyltransferase
VYVGYVRAWAQAARIHAHANIAPPILLGQAFAFAAGAPFDPWMAALAHTFGVLDHLYIVFANDYADREGDALHTEPTIFSGGSRVIPDGLIAPRALKRAAIGCACAFIALSCVGLAIDRPLLPLFALAAIALLYAYSYPPLRLAYRGLGELAQGVGVGVVLPLLGFYLQRGSFAGAPWAALCVLLVLGIASNVATALPDRDADRAAEKLTWVVRLGEKRARSGAVLLVTGALFALPLTAGLGLVELAIVEVVPALAILAAALLVPKDLHFVALIGGACFATQLVWAIVLFT